MIDLPDWFHQVKLIWAKLGSSGVCQRYEKQTFENVGTVGICPIVECSIIQTTIQLTDYLPAEIVETTFVVSRFPFLRVGSRISELRVIILPGTQIFKVRSQISDCSRFCFSFLKFYVPRITRPGATRNEKNTLPTGRQLPAILKSVNWMVP